MDIRAGVNPAPTDGMVKCGCICIVGAKDILTNKKGIRMQNNLRRNIGRNFFRPYDWEMI